MIRPGFALIEVVVAGALATIVLASAALLLQAQSRLASNTSFRSEQNDAARAALLTLRAELQPLAPAFDMRAVARDSIASRIFRGVGVVCGFRSATNYVRFHGLRLPDPAKDSVVQVGIENSSELISVTDAPSACPHRADEQVLAMTWPAPAPVGSVWLVFESGAYHLSTNALRYRRGAETRQPITAEVLNDRASAFYSVVDSAMRAVRVHLRARAGHAYSQDHILLLNHR